jgi:hypothetical protein
MKKIPVRYEIDDGVNIPVTRLHVPLRDLEVGQSVEFPKERRASIASIASRLKRETGRVFTIKITNESTCRIWRVE